MRYSKRTGLPILVRRSSGYYARKADNYRRLARDAKARGNTVSARWYGKLSREFKRKAKRTVSHRRTR